NDINISDLETIPAKYIFLGDYHQHQILPVKNSIAMYTGSIERTDMTEFDQIKGFVVHDDSNEENGGMGKARFIEYPKCRPMIEFRGNVTEIIKAIDDLPSKGVRGAIVKIAFTGTNKELMDFSSNLDEIRKRIKSKIDPIHIYHKQKVVDPAGEQSAHKLEEEIMEIGGLNEELILKVVEEMIIEKENDIEEQKILIGIASEIYKETME
ncbi:MAG: hypothetical protein WC119_07565, partial [Synergistaceae bacterium]